MNITGSSNNKKRRVTTTNDFSHFTTSTSSSSEETNAPATPRPAHSQHADEMRDEEVVVIPPRFAVPRDYVVVNDVDEQAIPAEGMPEGWTFIAVRRKTGNTNTRDKYWYSPKKSYKFNAAVKVRRFLAVLDQVGGDARSLHTVYI